MVISKFSTKNPTTPSKKIVISFEPDDNLAVRKLYTALADFLEKPTVEEEDLSYVKTGDLIMAYLKMRDDGLMTHEEFEEKKEKNTRNGIECAVSPVIF